MTYTGSCHCGGIRFEVDGELEGVTACNCSMCSRKGSLLFRGAEGLIAGGPRDVMSPGREARGDPPPARRAQGQR